MTTPTATTMSVPDFAEFRGFKRSYGYQLKKEGRLVMAAGGKQVLVAESLALHEATRDPSKAGVVARHAQARAEAAAPVPEAEPDAAEEDAPPGTPGRYDFQGSKAKREHFAALEAEASYRQKINELLEASEVRAVLAEIVTVLRVSIEGIAYRTAPILAATSDEVEVRNILTGEVEAALKTANESLAKLGRGEV